MLQTSILHVVSPDAARLHLQLQSSCSRISERKWCFFFFSLKHKQLLKSFDRWYIQRFHVDPLVRSRVFQLKLVLSVRVSAVLLLVFLFLFFSQDRHAMNCMTTTARGESFFSSWFFESYWSISSPSTHTDSQRHEDSLRDGFMVSILKTAVCWL